MRLVGGAEISLCYVCISRGCFDSRWFPSCEVLTPCTTRRSESLARRLSYLAVERRTKEIKTKTALIPFGGEAQKTKQLSYLSVERREKSKNKKQLSYLAVER